MVGVHENIRRTTRTANARLRIAAVCAMDLLPDKGFSGRGPGTVPPHVTNAFMSSLSHVSVPTIARPAFADASRAFQVSSRPARVRMLPRVGRATRTGLSSAGSTATALNLSVVQPQPLFLKTTRGGSVASLKLKTKSVKTDWSVTTRSGV